MAQREARSRLSAAHSARVGILDALRSRSVVPNYPRPRQSLVALPRCSALSSPSSSSRAPTRSSCLRVRVPSRWRRRAASPSRSRRAPTTRRRRTSRSSRTASAALQKFQVAKGKSKYGMPIYLPNGNINPAYSRRSARRWRRPRSTTARRSRRAASRWSRRAPSSSTRTSRKIGNVGSGKAYYQSGRKRAGRLVCGAPPPRADSAAHSAIGALYPAQPPRRPSPPPPPRLRSPPPPPPPPPLLRRRAAASPPPRAAISRLPGSPATLPPARSFRARAAWHWPFCGAWHQALAAGTRICRFTKVATPCNSSSLR